MLGNRPLVLDTFCEVYDLLRHLRDAEFWDLSTHEFVPGAIYLIGRRQFYDNRDRIRQLVTTTDTLVFLSNPAEGSDTLRMHCEWWGISDLVKAGQVLLISGGDMDLEWPHLFYENFLPKVLDYDENLSAQQRGAEIYSQLDKPYKFLFLNGRLRPHRRYLLDRFRANNLLDSAIWTNLDSAQGQTVQYLDPKYEFDFYQDRVGQDNTGFVKYNLFNDQWGEIYIKPEPYIDTYFSLVTETVFDYPYSFRTEKIWKPMVMGHPFVVASNRGYYQDLHDLGFCTFGHLIDESFDLIDDNQLRLERVARTVEDLCSQDLDKFVQAAADVCKYNQQRYRELRTQVRREFPQRFINYINERP